ncbi:MAG: hypothetical protein OXF20_05325 [Gammaproteobacteria bacterium]|nr:hypothetical protein [Gammaproteobacteria bacterium]
MAEQPHWGISIKATDPPMDKAPSVILRVFPEGLSRVALESALYGGQRAVSDHEYARLQAIDGD